MASKRVQVTLSDEEYAALLELSELRGESMSLILGGEIAGFKLLQEWTREAVARRRTLKRLEAAEAAMDEIDRAAKTRT